MSNIIRTSRELVTESDSLLRQFQSGDIVPITSGDPTLDSMLLGGYLPSTIHSIAGISGAGKSYRLQKLESHFLDNYDDLVLLRHNWEMTHLKLFLRRVAQETDRPIKEILFNPLEGNLKRIYEEVVRSESSPRLFYSPDPLIPEKFEEEVGLFLEEHPKMRVAISVDHAGLTKDAKGEGQKSTTDRLVNAVNRLNKKHTFLFWLILIQMNRDIEHRADPRHHPPRRSDLYATDTLYHLSDLVEVVHVPFRIGIERYMTFNKNRYDWLDDYKYESNSKTTSFIAEGNIFHHYIKSRMEEMMADAPNLFVQHIFDPLPEPEDEPEVDEDGEEKKKPKDGFDF